MPTRLLRHDPPTIRQPPRDNSASGVLRRAEDLFPAQASGRSGAGAPCPRAQVQSGGTLACCCRSPGTPGKPRETMLVATSPPPPGRRLRCRHGAAGPWPCGSRPGTARPAGKPSSPGCRLSLTGMTFPFVALLPPVAGQTPGALGPKAGVLRGLAPGNRGDRPRLELTPWSAGYEAVWPGWRGSSRGNPAPWRYGSTARGIREAL